MNHSLMIEQPKASRKRGDATDRWIGLRRRARTPRLRFITFPYAGSGASAYRRWLTDLAHEDWLDFVVVQLPGREKRISEPPYTEIGPLLGELEWVLSALVDLPYVLFGYSMGALLAYELALRLAVRGAVPQHLILAASTPPYRVRERAFRVTLKRDDLIAKIRRLGGTAPSLIDSDLFGDYFLPTLQADFALVDNFYREVPQVLPCPLLALGARDDPEVAVDQIQAWGAAAGRGFEVRLFNGGHFFLHSVHEEVIALVNTVVGRYRVDEQACSGVSLGDRCS